MRWMHCDGACCQLNGASLKLVRCENLVMIGQSPTPTPADPETQQPEPAEVPKEIGGRDGPEPTRYGDWEKNGRCVDF